MTDKIAALQREIESIESEIANLQDAAKDRKEKLEAARKIKPEDIVPGAKFYQKRRSHTAVKTVIQVGDDIHKNLYALMGVDSNEFRLGGELFHGIPYRNGAAEVAAWLAFGGWTKEPHQ
ncbi:dynactin subunit 2 [Burkholderia cepacia]|uniref:dynactin subunit 2 n=1 Tax=Burkholderia cepacia TaxID=292 RepID=UPI001CF49372|nr:dynactin subunit 2 [Burkholderia cepacia]MCA8110281.1 dynactin subunit 2 [Burkholderia cepacia]MCA8396580.1 dynactin subunit 2 [Burkholderia cepacia]